MDLEMGKKPDVGTSGTFSGMTSREVGRSGSPSESSIFRVHKRLREVNEKAYEPDIVSIGPYHRGKPGLEMMEVQKQLYLQLFLEQRSETNAERYINALRPLEGKVRKCYAEYISLESKEFVDMMLLDGFFIIEVILRFGGKTMTDPNNPKTDPRKDLIFKTQWMINSLQRDLILFENQLPLFVLIKILDTVKGPSRTTNRPFFEQALRFFDGLSPSASSTHFSNVTNYFDRENNPLEVWHLLELVHKSRFALSASRREHDSGERKSRRFIPSTTELQEAGVKFKAARRSLFDVKFEGGVLQVPSLTVEDRTETFFRNLIAYEQYRPICRGNEPSPFTDYVTFLDCLIDTPKDVQTLSRLKIIDNWLGDNEAVSTMFNRIGEAVVVPRNSFLYGRVIAGVNDHCSRRRNRWMAMLNRDYFNSPWALISVLAALLLLVLTLTQTVFAVFPRK